MDDFKNKLKELWEFFFPEERIKPKNKEAENMRKAMVAVLLYHLGMLVVCMAFLTWRSVFGTILLILLAYSFFMTLYSATFIAYGAFFVLSLLYQIIHIFNSGPLTWIILICTITVSSMVLIFISKIYYHFEKEGANRVKRLFIPDEKESYLDNEAIEKMIDKVTENEMVHKIVDKLEDVGEKAIQQIKKDVL